MCVLEKIARLQASVLAYNDASEESPSITVGVSIERGVPAHLVFTLLQYNSSFTETREITSNKGIFHIGHHFQGTANQKPKTSELL